MLFSTWEWIRLLGLLSYFYFSMSIFFGLLRKSSTLKSNKNLYFQLHQMSGWMGFITVIVHLLLLMIDQYEPYTISEIVLPFSANYQALLSGLGTIAFYLFLIVLLTSDIWINKMNFSLWKKMHFLVLPAWILSLIHGLFIGTDSNQMLIILFYSSTVIVIITALLVRLMSDGFKKKDQKQRVSK